MYRQQFTVPNAKSSVKRVSFQCFTLQSYFRNNVFYSNKSKDIEKLEKFSVYLNH